jgi:D-xylose 1-dehydrogenase
MSSRKRDSRYPSLEGKGVLVTGGANGIGKAIGRAFADQGASVAVLDLDRAAGDALVGELGEPHRLLVCDVTKADELRAATDEVAAAFGRLDVVIANAADDTRHDLAEVTQELWEASLSLNLSHQFFAAQAAERHLRASAGGSVICLGSIAWLNNTTGMVAYTTAKAGIHGLVRTLARLWGGHGIRVNALLPGWTMTEKQLERWVDERAEREIETSQCLPGRVEPSDVARAALFLASDDAAMITRQALTVDGGWT